jgi:RNA polymerase sigma factor (sigma-70 family)
LKDSEIIEGIRSGSQSTRNKVFHYLYHKEDLWKKVRGIVFPLGASENDMHELFQYGLIVLDRKIREDGFQLSSSLDTYFCGVIKNKWKYDQYARKKNTSLISIDEVSFESREGVEYLKLFNQESKNILWKIIEKMNNRCKELLPKWALGVSGEELCKEFGFSDISQAKKESYRCRQKLKEYVNSVPGLKDKLMDLITN